MFSIGGVAALKQHAFFSGLDWQALEALKLTPPIDLSVRYANTTGAAASGGGNSTKNTPQKSNTTGAAAVTGSPDVEGGGAEEVWSSTAHFDEEFTNRLISTSFIEDTMYSTTHTPVRSRANSGDAADSSAVDEYAGFDFAVEKFECTLQQMREFEAELQAKIAKQNKKKALRMKNEEKRLADEAVKKQAAEKEAAEKKRVEEEKRLQKVRAEEQRQLELRRKERRRVLQLQVEQNKTHNAIVREYEEKCSKVGKRLKANRKKLRDIQTLEESVASGATAKLSSEQRDKLKRKGDLEAEIARDSAEEEALLSGGGPGPLLCEDVEELLRLEEEQEGESSKGNIAGVVAPVERVATAVSVPTPAEVTVGPAAPLTIEAPQSSSPIPVEESPAAEEVQPEKKTVWVSPRVQALMRQQQEAALAAATTSATQKTQEAPSESKSAESVTVPPNTEAHVHKDHKHATSGGTSGAGGSTASGGGCGCGDHLNSSSISKKEFKRQKDEWETVTSSSKNKKKTDKR